ncbi:MAG: aspartate--tRNA(Asn) ligase [Rickettsiales bacterium]|jgi:aspartyl-tRNA synthetase|nr:aspartate--tRNA(Asn) ligase [Rickettsiales bacterium]
MKQVRTHIAELSQLKTGDEITIAGHAQIVRAQSSVAFIILRDITGSIQCVIGKEHPQFAEAAELTTESVLKISGKIAEAKITPSTPFGMEIQIESFCVLSRAEPLPIPVVEKGGAEVSDEKRQDWRYLVLRRERDATIMKALSALNHGYHEFLISEGFLEIHTPKLMGSASEAHLKLFHLDYFGGTAYLAQSPQLFKQMAIASGLERVFEVGPVFRANPAFTTRHHTEYTSYDIEMGYIESFDEVMEVLEKTVAYILTSIKKSVGKDIKKHFGISDFQLKKPIPRITMHQAKKILRERGIVSAKADLSTEEEKAIGEYVKEELDSDFVFITEFPWESRPFYHKKGVSSDTGEPISVSADLIYKGLELTTLAQREEDYKTLCAQVAEKDLKQEGLQWYLDCFRFGMPPHGGFGMGGGRLVKQLLDLPTVRDSDFLYRGPNRMIP